MTESGHLTPPPREPHHANAPNLPIVGAIWHHVLPKSTRPTQLQPPTRSDPDTRLQEGQYETSVPTIADRVAQTVVAARLEAKVEPIFHPDSYGYRPGRSAQDAVEVCRHRCWRTDWVIDLDIQKFFDSVPGT